MKTTYISRAKFGKFTAAIAAAALLAGTTAPGVLAADYTAQLTKTIDMTAAPGAGVPHGSITFTVGTVANLPSWAAGTAIKGTAAQIKSTELTAAFTGGTVNTVTVPFTFDSDDFTAPGDYIFSLTETAAGITGLTQDTAARYIVVRVVNTDPTALFDFTCGQPETIEKFGNIAIPEGDKLVQFHISVTNTSDETYDIFKDDFQLQWGDGDNDFGVAIYPVTPEMFPNDTKLEPGATVEGNMLVAVPSDTATLTVAYQEVLGNGNDGNNFFVDLSL